MAAVCPPKAAVIGVPPSSPEIPEEDCCDYTVGQEEGPGKIPHYCSRPCCRGVIRGRPPRQILLGDDGREHWVSVIDELLERHCTQLLESVDSRLAAHLGTGPRSPRDRGHSPPPGRPSVRSSTGIASVPAGRLSVRSAPDCRTSLTSTESRMARASKQDLMTFEESEQMKRYSAGAKMKDRVKLLRRRGSVMWAEWRPTLLRKCIESQWFELLICLLIVSNAVVLGYEVEVYLRVGATTLPPVLRAMEAAYTACFTTELLLRFLVFGPTKLYCTEGERIWNIVDLLLVVTSLISLGMQTSSGEKIHSFDNMRMTRLFRASRIFRVVRIMKFFRPLRVLLASILGTLRSIFWTLFLLTMVIYMFGILFTIAASQTLNTDEDGPSTKALDHYFGSLAASVSTFFMVITGGVDWSECWQALSMVDSVWKASFLCYVALCNFAVLNVVTGIVCQTAIESAQRDQEVVVESHLAMQQKYVDQLRSIFEDIDMSGSGWITLGDFEEKMQDGRLITYFAAMDLTVGQAWNLFKLLDVDEVQAIDFEQFVAGCLRLRGTARGVDLHMLIYESKWVMSKLMIIMKQLEDLETAVFSKPHDLTRPSLRHGLSGNL